MPKRKQIDGKALIDNMKIKKGQAFQVKKVASEIQFKKVAKEG